jgi:hypothetical protein
VLLETLPPRDRAIPHTDDHVRYIHTKLHVAGFWREAQRRLFSGS